MNAVCVCCGCVNLMCVHVCVALHPHLLAHKLRARMPSTIFPMR